MTQFSRKKLNTLLHGVIFTIQDELFDNDKFDSLVLDDEKNLKFNILFAKFSLSFVEIIKEEPIEIFEKIIDLLNEFNIDSQEIKNLFFSYFEYYYNWLCQCCDYKAEELESAIKNFELIVKEQVGVELDLVNEDGVLIFATDSKFDDLVDRKHFTDAKKISAVEFMQGGFIDDDLKADMIEATQHFKNIDNFIISLSEDYIKSVAEVMKDFSKIFSYGNEFKLLNESIEHFIDKIEEYDIENLSEDQKILFKEFISNIVEDLIEWSKKVIFEQSVGDIHYLDSSINANISQFDIILESIK